MSWALIGGSGFESWQNLDSAPLLKIDTPFGKAFLQEGEINKEKFYFLSRHGIKHDIAPHLINYQANIWALKEVGVQKIVALNAVGSLSLKYAPGEIMIIDDFLDFTKNRANTFYDKFNSPVVHINCLDPYCKAGQTSFIETAEKLNLKLYKNGVYVGVEGPRFESPAEIKMFAKLGGHVVGMTGLPEVVLANEAGICYNAIAIIANYGVGLGEKIQPGEVFDCMSKAQKKVELLITEWQKNKELIKPCDCKERAKGI